MMIRIYQALSFIYLAACLLLLESCNALTVHRYNKLGYHSVSYQHTKLQNSKSTSNERIESSSNEEPNIIHQTLHRLHVNRVKKNKNSNTNRLGHRILVSYAEINDKRRATKAATNMHNLMHSIALVATCRRLSFLILSITIVNFIKSTIFKASTVIGRSNDDDIDILISNSYNSNPHRYQSNKVECLMSVRGHLLCSMILTSL